MKKIKKHRLIWRKIHIRKTEKGIFNKEVAAKFKDNVLSKGGTELLMELYKRFRGQEPKADALLKRAGLL